MNTQRSFVMLKPDVLQRRIVGDIISRFEKKGLNLVGLKMLTIPQSLAQSHYGEHSGKDFFQSLISYITAGPVVAMVFEGESAVPVIRKLCGPTRVEEAPPGTIRGDYTMHTAKNIVHASDSPESAEKEVNLFFRPEEIFSWTDGNSMWF